jgi:hypothetical protein
LQTFTRITDRMDHVADHFRGGFKIDDWAAQDDL